MLSLPFLFVVRATVAAIDEDDEDDDGTRGDDGGTAGVAGVAGIDDVAFFPPFLAGFDTVVGAAGDDVDDDINDVIAADMNAAIDDARRCEPGGNNNDWFTVWSYLLINEERRYRYRCCRCVTMMNNYDRYR